MPSWWTSEKQAAKKRFHFIFLWEHVKNGGLAGLPSLILRGEGAGLPDSLH